MMRSFLLSFVLLCFLSDINAELKFWFTLSESQPEDSVIFLVRFQNTEKTTQALNPSIWLNKGWLRDSILISNNVEAKLFNTAFFSYLSTNNEIIFLDPDEQFEFTVDLTENSFFLPGTYSVVFKPNLPSSLLTNLIGVNVNFQCCDYWNVSFPRALRPRLSQPLIQYRRSANTVILRGVDRDTPASPSVTGNVNNTDDYIVVQDAYFQSYNYLYNASKGLISSPTEYIKWFGTNQSDYFQIVTKNIDKVLKHVKRGVYIFYLHEQVVCLTNPKNFEFIAWTILDTKIIFLCDSFFSDFNTREQASIFINQYLHDTTMLSDMVLSETECKQLARDHPDLAINNDANYFYYINSFA
eukprot:TRINITY_DN28599_c0_g1_i1.p1 TRINITY_DN28599_c0_g1~~TRINITY_DN28599_c0_g1_i1.p1  ORF type:complete len:355 (-),score=30.94 TRINITY_DN28599_c0_g1_i1:395-1459(-)